MSQLSNMTISGSGSVNGGEYAAVRISGSGSINGDVKCGSMHISGSGKVRGTVTCEDDIVISGSGKISGAVECASISTSGSASTGALKAGNIKISGVLIVDGDIEADKIYSSGALRASGNISAESAEIRGGINVQNLLSAETVHIYYGNGCSIEIGEIGGSKIEICPSCSVSGNGVNGGILGFVFKGNVFSSHSSSKVKVGTIEGDDILLEGCEIGTVRGARVRIGRDCKIDRVEYSESVEIAEDAKIGSSVKV